MEHQVRDEETSLLSTASREAKRVLVAFGIFRQLERKSKRRLVSEENFLSALREVGFDFSVSKEILIMLRHAGKIYEPEPLQFRSIL